MSHKSNYITILQFDERLISRLRLKTSTKGIEIVAHDVERGAWSARDGSLDAALKAFAARHRLVEDRVYTVLPRHEITARILKLPSQDLTEIGGMIRLNCDEYVPYPLNELLIDQCMVQTLPDGQARVLAVFTHRDIVNAHVETLKNAGILPEDIFLSTACLASAAIAAAGPKPPRFALVNLASGGLEVVVLDNNHVTYGRAVASTTDWNAGSNEDNLPDILEEVQVELRASLSAYRRESDETEALDTVYLCSDCTDAVERYACSLANEFAEECLAAPFVPRLVTGGQELLQFPALTALGAGLLAQERGEVAVRLLPESILAARRVSGLKRKLLRYAAMAGLVVVAFGLLYAQAVSQRREYLRDLETRIARIEPRAKGIAAKQKQLAILKEQVERTQSVIELLAALVDLFPATGMNITRFNYTHRDRIELWGRAKTLTDIDKLTEDLRAVGKSTISQFARAQQAYYSRNTERNQEVLDYKIIMPFSDLSGPEDEEEETEIE